MNRVLRLVLISAGACIVAVAVACAGGAGSIVSTSDSGVVDDGGPHPSLGIGDASGGGVVTPPDAAPGDAGTPVPGPYDQCDAAAECAWGEIEHEILKASDCMCLFGCPFLGLSKSTVDRRASQYKTICTTGKDGEGHPCPIDDCAPPPPISCTNHKCGAGDAGNDS